MDPSVINLSDKDLDPPEGEKWVLVEEDGTGKWFGTGLGLSADSDETLYISGQDSDESYEAAILSASDWARKNQVSNIYVRRLRSAVGVCRDQSRTTGRHHLHQQPHQPDRSTGIRDGAPVGAIDDTMKVPDVAIATPCPFGVGPERLLAGPIGGGEPGLWPGEVAGIQHGRDHGVLAQRAVTRERGANGVGQFLPALAGRVEHERPGVLVAGEPGEVAGEDGLAGLRVGLLDDNAALRRARRWPWRV